MWSFLHIRGQHTFSVKNQIGNMSGFGHLYCNGLNSAISTQKQPQPIQKQIHVCSNKLYLQRRSTGHIWPTGCSLLTNTCIPCSKQLEESTKVCLQLGCHDFYLYQYQIILLIFSFLLTFYVLVLFGQLLTWFPTTPSVPPTLYQSFPSYYEHAQLSPFFLPWIFLDLHMRSVLTGLVRKHLSGTAHSLRPPGLTRINHPSSFPSL